MRKLHLALSTHDIGKTVEDYSQRLGLRPCVIVPDQYALWRTQSLNLSVRHDTASKAGCLRHLGWEDSSAKKLSNSTDINGLIWEHFSAAQQADEINELWPDVNYEPDPL